MIASAAVIGGCGGREAASLTPTQSPVEATLTINLATPNAGDGAILFTVAGPSILRVTARPGLEMTETTTTENGRTTSTVLVRGDLASGPIGSLTVRGADAGAEYTTEVRQVAAGASGGYALRSDLTAYRLATQR
jgi:hypothetical protein